MPLVRVIPLKNFLDTALSTGSASATTAYSTVAPVSGQTVYGGLHLNAISTARVLGMTLQSASSSGFGSPTTEISFTLSSEIGSTWATLASPSTDRAWRRATWALSTAGLTTGGTWSGAVWVGIQ